MLAFTRQKEELTKMGEERGKKMRTLAHQFPPSNQKTSPIGKSKANTWEKFINTLLSGRRKGKKKYANIVPHCRKLIDIAQRKRPNKTIKITKKKNTNLPIIIVHKIQLNSKFSQQNKMSEFRPNICHIHKCKYV